MDRTRDEFFAGSRLTQDQHAGICGRHDRQQIQRRFQGCALSNDLVEFRANLRSLAVDATRWLLEFRWEAHSRMSFVRRGKLVRRSGVQISYLGHGITSALKTIVEILSAGS